MFPNGFPGGYSAPFYSSYMPRMGMNMGMGMRMNPMARAGGLFSRLAGGGSGLRAGMGAAARGINWQGLLSNVSRTLGVINQAVPLVKQVGPMYNNMKSMLRVASLFKDETDPVPVNNNNNNNNDNNSNNKTSTTQTTSTSKNDNVIQKENITAETKENTEKENTIINNNYSNVPNFFI